MGVLIVLLFSYVLYVFCLLLFGVYRCVGWLCGYCFVLCFGCLLF